MPNRDRLPVAMRNAAPDDRFAYLALIRFCMASIVLFCHLGLTGTYGEWRHMFEQMGAFSAVLIFFVVSGYSIAHSYQQRPEGFYKRRLLRVYPIYAVALVVYLAFLSAHPEPIITSGGDHGGPFPPVNQIVLNALFLNGIFTGNVIGPAWSLSIEVAFYALTPLLYIIATRWPIVFGALIGASAGLYWLHDDLGLPYYSDTAYGIGIMALFCFWGSAFLFYLRPSVFLGIAFTGLYIVLLRHYNPLQGHYSVKLMLIASLLIFFSRKLPLLKGWLRGAFNYLGEISYPVYIVHYPLIIYLNSQYDMENRFLIALAVFGASAFLVATTKLDITSARKGFATFWPPRFPARRQA